MSDEKKDRIIQTLQAQVDELLRVNGELSEENAGLRRSLEESYDENVRFRELSMIDPLTELWNLRGLETLIEATASNITPPGAEEHRRRKASVPASAAILLDVDFFKEFNEAYTHAGGDAILRHVAHSLRDNEILNAGEPHPIRKSDILGRWGGDEFFLYLYGAGVEEVASRLKDADGKLRIHVPPAEVDGKQVTVTLSGGLVECNFDETLESIVRRASRALYVAKSGRNQVVQA